MDVNNLEKYFAKCRDSVYKADAKQFLLSKIAGSEQESDLTVPSNCNGYGRIRHFRRCVDERWVADPLPIDPACKALGIPYVNMLETQVFQIATCNVHCWYCFVPDELKRSELAFSRWFTAEQMVKAYSAVADEVRVIDLSGGNPELVPEWIIETMKALEKYNLSEQVYLWSDDTLTTDYTFDFLPAADIEYLKRYKNYGKVCCFKGFDSESFSFNCTLPDFYFDKQFERFSKYLDLGIDLYGYATFTAEDYSGVGERMSNFMDRLQRIHPLLPLRIVPLKISMFSPVKGRVNESYLKALDNQYLAIDAWKQELNIRFNKTLLETRISDIQIK